jgi:glutamyl-tRNA reductase
VIQVVGTNHKHTPVDARECLARGEPARVFLQRAREALGARECVLLLTCNRVELYYVAPPDPWQVDAAKGLLCETAGPGVCLSPESVYHHTGEEAVVHLFEVAAGLDSLVLGEHEILGQVKVAAPEAVQQGFAGPVLKRLFECAARAAEGVLGSLQGKRLMVFGAGRIAQVTAKHMAAHGAGPITVFSRTFARAQELAEAAHGRAISAIDLPEALAESDIVVGCTAAPHHVVTVHHIQAAMHDRAARPLVVVDLGVPRNVDPAVSRLPGVQLFNIDDLESIVAEHIGEREQEIERVRVIVAEEVEAFSRWFQGTRVTSLISELRERAEQARQECAAQAARQLSETDAATVDYLLDLLVRKLLHHPIAALRESSADPETDDLAAAVRRLFALGDGAEAEVAAGSVGGEGLNAEQEHPSN